MSGFWRVCSFLTTQYLVGPTLAWITAWMCCGIVAICMWYCVGVMEAQVAFIDAFRSSLLLGLESLVFVLSTAHRFSVGFREFADQSRTGTPRSLKQLLVPLAVGRCQENKISISILLVSRGEQVWSTLEFPGRWLHWLLTSENNGPTPADDVETSHWV